MKILLSTLFLFGFYACAQVCNPNGNIIIFSNYDGGSLNIDVDVNIPNLKIGVVSYEAVEVTFTGAYVNNITGIEYAGFNNGGNTTCGGNIATTTFTGMPGGVTPNIEFVPPVTYSDPNGYMYIDCGYSCGTGNQGGCNTAAQIYAYFESVFAGTVYSHKTQYGCWSGTQSLSGGGNCCAAPPAPSTPPVADFSISDNMICVGDCVNFTDLTTNSPTSWQWDFTPNQPATSTDQNPSGICYTAPGVYQVTLIASNTDGSDTITQSITVIGVDTSIYVNGTTLTSGATIATYQWIDCATNLPVAGATSSYFNPTVNGSYAVIVTQNGCTDTSACGTVNSLGLDQLSIADFLTIAPNPSKGIFIVVDQQGKLSDQLVTVTNLLGETVYSARITDQKTSIDLSSAKDGIYLVSVGSDRGQLVTKIVKE
ncbi:T9SS type A sorting domain-containing protein [Fluviicola sp.]|uniref:T9SS type A sorting domain-containing protein n=1 Tax=Fluviicola sp. TaxID=1917219 RepID=UPI0031D6CD6E